MNVDIDAEYVRSLLDYDPYSGVLTWKVSRRGCARPGRIAGSKHSSGYVQVVIDQKPYFAHRLAWLITYGAWPDNIIDHVNRDGSDNRIANLRQADKTLNLANIKAERKGCYFVNGKWQSTLRFRNRKIHLGTFATEQEAKAAYLSARAKYFGDFDAMGA